MLESQLDRRDKDTVYKGIYRYICFRIARVCILCNIGIGHVIFH